MNDDAALLRRYADDGSEPAFAEFVQRHLGLVYSSALRRLQGDAHLAADVSQAVFVKAAQQAGKLARHPAPAAWLFATTRNTSVDLARKEHRRRRREQETIRMHESPVTAESAEEWEQLKPVLDAAMDELDERDRTAILLRCLEHRPFAEVGAVLQVQEDAARMRVDRALEKLRRSLARRGVASTAGALALLLAGKATATIPAGLAAAVTETALSAGPAVGATSWLLACMSSTKTTVIASAVAFGAIGLATYQSRQLRIARETIATLRRPADPAPVVSTTAGPDAASARLAEMLRESKSAKAPATVPPPAGAEGIQARVAALKEILARLPEQGIPELQLATDSDWYAAVDGKLETTEDFRRALGKLRAAAESRFARLVQPALRDYLRTHQNQFPEDLQQLLPMAGDGIDSAMLRRYKVARAAEIPNVRMGGEWIITQRGLIDSEYDQASVIGPNGSGATTMTARYWEDLALIRPAMKAHEAATGQRHTDILQVLPYATTPEQQAVIRRWAQKSGTPNH